MLLKLFICFCGVFFSYLLNGIALEYITKAFGVKILTFYLFVVLVPSLFNVIFAKLVILCRQYYEGEKEESVLLVSKERNVPKKFYFLCSLLFMGSMLAANASLVHINYPTQLILKSGKPIPILLCGTLFLRKQFQRHRYISTLVIVFGVMSFMYNHYVSQQTTSSTKDQNDGRGNLLFGWMLVFASLSCDGAIATVQNWMRQFYELDPHEMMYYINVYASLFLGCAVVVNGELQRFFVFVKATPHVSLHLLLLGFTSAIGQNFIYYTITTFGPLTCSIVTTTRKFCNVLLSVFLFAHVMSLNMWLSVLIVFVGLVLDVWIPFKNSST